MFNDITLGPITIHMYGVMIGIGFLSAYFLSAYRGKKQKLNDDIIWGIFLCAVFGGLLGCKILYYIIAIPDIIKDPSILWDFRNGYVVYGGIIGGILSAWLYCKRKKENFLSYFDLVMPAVAMAQGFGRLGCFFAGCCYGRTTQSCIGITFQHSDFAPNGVKLLPTQLMSSAGDFLICISLLLFAKKNKVKGRVASLYLILYGIGRFLIEFFRNDYRGSIGFLSTSQIISIGIVAAGIVMFMIMPKYNKAEATEEKAEIKQEAVIEQEAEDVGNKEA